MTYREPQPNIPGWMSCEELQWLYETAQRMESIVEIGSWQGRSTHALLSGCRGVVYAVDHFKGSPAELGSSHALAKTTAIRPLFDAHVGMFPNLQVFEMDSGEAAARFTEKSIEMVFIDGEHTYESAKRDIELWMPKCRVLICGHDQNQDGVPRALRDVFGKDYKHEVGSIWSHEICAQ